MLQPIPYHHGYRRGVQQSLIFMIKMCRRKLASTVLHMVPSRAHNSTGNITLARLVTEIIMVDQNTKMMRANHPVDQLTQDTVRVVTSKSVIGEVMVTREDIIIQRVIVSLNQNGCNLVQAVGLTLWN